MLEREFIAFMAKHALWSQGEKLLLGVSGGVDSMTLATLLLRTRVPFVMAHCNFGLRGEESDGDEELVRRWAENNGVRLYVKRFNTAHEAQTGSLSLPPKNPNPANCG